MTRAVLTAIAMLAVTSQFASAAPFSCPNTVRVSILTDGKFLIDGNPGNIQALNARFAAVSGAGGTVWLYTENDGHQSHAVEQTSDAVVRSVMDNHLAIIVSDKPDFSDKLLFDVGKAPRSVPRSC